MSVSHSGVEGFMGRGFRPERAGQENLALTVLCVPYSSSPSSRVYGFRFRVRGFGFQVKHFEFRVLG